MFTKLIATSITLTVVLSAPAFAGWRSDIVRNLPPPRQMSGVPAAPRVVHQSVAQLAENVRATRPVVIQPARTAGTAATGAEATPTPSSCIAFIMPVPDVPEPKFCKVYKFAEPTFTPATVVKNGMTAVPEPASVASLLTGMCGLGFFFRKQSFRK